MRVYRTGASLTKLTDLVGVSSVTRETDRGLSLLDIRSETGVLGYDVCICFPNKKRWYKHQGQVRQHYVNETEWQKERKTRGGCPHGAIRTSSLTERNSIPHRERLFFPLTMLAGRTGVVCVSTLDFFLVLITSSVNCVVYNAEHERRSVLGS